MRTLWDSHVAYFSIAEHRRSLIQAVLWLVACITVSNYAIGFATRKASNYVEDIILSNIPAFDLDVVFVYGTFAHLLILAWVLLSKPSRIPFGLKVIGLFVLIRAGFVVMTHFAPYPVDIEPTPSPFFNSMFFADDLFFSGHTGLPFLGALVFWHYRPLRYFYLASSIFFGIVVLLGHYHYTIDVLSAFFITYGIFHLARDVFFTKDWAKMVEK